MSDLYDGIATNQATGRNEPPSLVDTLANAVTHWRKLDMNQFKSLNPEQYEKFGGEKTMTLSASNGEAVDFPVGALVMTKEYYEHRAVADAKHWKIIATETAFGVLDDLIIGSDHKVIVAYEGRPDIIALDTSNRLMPLDQKTKDYVDVAKLTLEYKPHPQTAGYVYCLNELVKQLGLKDRIVDRCMIIASGRLPPQEPRDKTKPKKPRFAQIPVDYSLSELEEWRDQTVAKAHRLRDAFERHMFLMKDSSCHYQYGSPCEFRNVCRAPVRARALLLQKDYEVTKPWSTGDPKKRGEKA